MNFIEIDGTLVVKGLDLPANSKYPCKVGVKVEFPLNVTYKNKLYVVMNKYSTDVKSGLPCANYTSYDSLDKRIWLRCDGTILED